MNVKSLSYGLSEYIYLSETPYADRDANGFNQAITDFHSPSLNQVFLNNKLTKTIFIKRFKEFCNDLTENSLFYFFFAGHGCSSKGCAYLSCYDSEIGDLDTWIELDMLLEIVSESKCKKVMFFIDACQDESPDAKDRGNLVDQLDYRESFKIQDDNNFKVVLFSSSEGEKANIRESKKHGIWSYFLIQAFRGENEGKDALNDKLELYLNKLHEYLHLYVKDFYRGLGKAPKQSSKIKGEYQIDPLLGVFLPSHVERYEGVPENALPQIFFETNFERGVKKLDGFDKKRRHSVPKYYNQTTLSWVQEKGDRDIQNVMDTDSEKIIEIFDLDPSQEIADGGYEIENSDNSGFCNFKCKYFEYSIYLDYQESDLDNVTLTFTLKPLDQDKLFQMRESLDECFTHWFDSMVMHKAIGDTKKLYGKLMKASEVKDLLFHISLYLLVNVLKLLSLMEGDLRLSQVK